MVQRTALITGITGQDGYYLTRLLLEKGYTVHGIVRRASTMNRTRIDQLKLEMPDAAARVILHYGDLTDAASLHRLVDEIAPDEIYNLAAQSHVRVSFDTPLYTQQVNADGALNVLESARVLNNRKPVRVYQASTSEMFGGMPGTVPQSEATPFHPRSPYGCAKVAAFYYTVHYRESCGLFACNGILFNHESPMRGETFVTRKITLAATRIKMGLQSTLRMGNLKAERDWGFAGDYVEAMWRMLQQPQPDDFVISTGQMHSVEEFLVAVFTRLELDWREYVQIDPQYFRATEVEQLCGDSRKARELLGWQPRTSFTQLVDLMVAHDLRLAKQERDLAGLASRSV
ncbi:GDP-mannose 4,6-dehydratase [Planctomyces sp. SH-PL14]|uniref:GDP-mannose 4,6-dehydratase n=1 Tax=Planctomyces sp. SH-PL14 TaxID=1632864 RepID=UPI0009468893|nr:GDP-mannose 4,6-dehydratase [Planctomyces sp. SH-PL14]